MPAQITRTLNPLPFHDLEPHRFEDLVRQLAYGWRTWVSLEALGRAGQDEGMDIRGIEAVADERSRVDDEEGSPDAELDEPTFTDPRFAERMWVIQCKREKSMGSSALKKTIEASLRSLSSPPHGFVLAVAADVSKKARDLFRAEMVSRGVKEFHLWARGELEDMLFQAQNDNLLFAYFNLSLQPRRRGIATALRSNLTIKSRLRRLVDTAEKGDDLILLRDATDTTYPHRLDGKPTTAPSWRLCEVKDLRYPGHLTVVSHKRLAAIADDDHGWDCLLGSDDLAAEAAGRLDNMRAWGQDDEEDPEADAARSFWRDHIEDRNQAHLHEYRLIPFERIVAIDFEGDGYFPVPHLFVIPDPQSGFFDSRGGGELVPVRSPTFTREADHKHRTNIFPKQIPVDGAAIPRPFDATLPTGVSLGAGVRKELRDKLAQSSPHQTSAQERSGYDHVIAERLAAFALWKATIGLPEMSAWSRELRKQGQRAWVVETSSAYDALSKEPSLSLRFRIGRSRADASIYWATGALKVASGHSGWHFTSEPDASGRHRSDPIPVPPEGPSADLLTRTMLGVIDRLTHYA